jgi:hypothetical protein
MNTVFICCHHSQILEYMHEMLFNVAQAYIMYEQASTKLNLK